MINAYSLTSQSLTANENLIFDNTKIITGCSVRHFDGLATFTITKPGYYFVTFNGTITDTAAGNVSVQLLNNDEEVDGAAASATIAATTDEQSLGFSTIIKVLPSCCAIDNTTVLKISNVGADATFSVANIVITKLC